MRKYIYPEKMRGIGNTPLERVINEMCLCSNMDTRKAFDKLSKNDKDRIKNILDRDREDNNKFADHVGYALKTILDIKKLNFNTPTYKISENFFKLVKTLNRGIPCRSVQLHNKYKYFIFNDTEFEGAFVTSWDFSDAWDYDNERDTIENNFLGLKIALTNKEYDPTNMKVFNMAIVGSEFNIENIDHVKNTKEMGGRETSCIIYSGDDIDKYYPTIVGILNTLIYLNSKDPDIEQLKPLRLYNKKQLRIIGESKSKSVATVPIKLVGWSYYGRNYSVDETMVSGHLRWQPCGVKNTDVKLIWINEHSRGYESNITKGI